MRNRMTTRDRTTWMSSIIVVLLALITPATVAGQSAEERIQNALDQAEEAGIPTSLLESKVAEGRAKGVPMDRIADAVQRRLQGLDRAREALANVPNVDGGDLDVGADALESGVSAAVLSELAETAPGDQRAAAIAALGYLVEAEMAPPQALERVREALSRGPQALQNLPAQARGPGAAGPPDGAGPADGVPGAGPPTDVGPPDGVPAPGDAPRGGPPSDGGPPGGGGPSDGGGPPDGGGGPPDSPGPPGT